MAPKKTKNGGTWGRCVWTSLTQDKGGMGTNQPCPLGMCNAASPTPRRVCFAKQMPPRNIHYGISGWRSPWDHPFRCYASCLLGGAISSESVNGDWGGGGARSPVQNLASDQSAEDPLPAVGGRLQSLSKTKKIRPASVKRSWTAGRQPMVVGGESTAVGGEATAI